MSKKKSVFKLTCEYCKFYHLHTCAASREQVNGSSLACNNFEMADIFWCDKNSYHIHTAACLKRQEHNHPGCVRCRQGNAMRGLTRQKQLLLFDRFHYENG